MTTTDEYDSQSGAYTLIRVLSPLDCYRNKCDRTTAYAYTTCNAYPHDKTSKQIELLNSHAYICAAVDRVNGADIIGMQDDSGHASSA